MNQPSYQNFRSSSKTEFFLFSDHVCDRCLPAEKKYSKAVGLLVWEEYFHENELSSWLLSVEEPVESNNHTSSSIQTKPVAVWWSHLQFACCRESEADLSCCLSDMMRVD